MHSSLLISPISLAILIFSPISGFAQAHVNAKWLILIGFIVMASGYMWFAFGALMSQMQKFWQDLLSAWDMVLSQDQF